MADLKNTSVTSTGMLVLPSGTTAQRPGETGQPAAANGQIRYNTTTSKFEYYENGWKNVIEDGTLDENITQPRALLKCVLNGDQTVSVGGSQITLSNWTTDIEVNNNGIMILSSDRITFLKDGLYRVHAHVPWYQNASDESEYRNNPQVALYLNGSTKFPGAGQQTYIRNGYNHRYSSGITEIVYQFSAGDYVQVKCRTESERNSGKTGSVDTAVSRGFTGTFFAEELNNLQFVTKNGGSDTNINRNITTSWSGTYNTNGTVVTNSSVAACRVSEAGYYRATTSIESRGGVGEGGSRQTPVIRFTNGGSNGRSRVAHGYQRTDGLETGLYMMDIFNCNVNDTIDLRSQQGSNGSSWNIDYSESWFRVEKMLPAEGQTEPKFLARYSDQTTQLNAGSVVIDFNQGYHNSGDFITYSGTRFIAQVPGLYRVFSLITHGGNEARFSPLVRIRKNGSTFTGAMGGMGYSRDASGHTYADCVVEDYVLLRPSEYVEIYAQDENQGIGSGTMRLNNAFGSSSWAMVEYIAPYPGAVGA